MPTQYYWYGVTSTAFGTNTNWIPNGVPTTGDTIIFDIRAVGPLAGSDQSAITVAAMRVYMSYTQSYLGTVATGTKLKIGATICEIGLPPPDGSQGSGCAQIAIDLNSIDSKCTIYNSRSGGTVGEPVVIYATDASSTLIVLGGTVGVATGLPGETSTFGSISVKGGTVNCSNGVTCATFNNNGGKLTINGATTTLNQRAGTTISIGTGLIGTVNGYGGTLDCRSRPGAGVAITTANHYGATLDFSGNPASTTITTWNFRSGTFKQYAAGQVTRTTTVLDENSNTTLNLSFAA